MKSNKNEIKSRIINYVKKVVGAKGNEILNHHNNISTHLAGVMKNTSKALLYGFLSLKYFATHHSIRNDIVIL